VLDSIPAELLGGMLKQAKEMVGYDKPVKLIVVSNIAIAITGNGIASIAAGMAARDTLTPILTGENDEIKQIV
jgi:hypothetical protein